MIYRWNPTYPSKISIYGIFLLDQTTTIFQEVTPMTSPWYGEKKYLLALGNGMINTYASMINTMGLLLTGAKRREWGLLA